jgi:hypothetical protein
MATGIPVDLSIYESEYSVTDEEMAKVLAEAPGLVSGPAATSSSSKNKKKKKKPSGSESGDKENKDEKEKETAAATEKK